MRFTPEQLQRVAEWLGWQGLKFQYNSYWVQSAEQWYAMGEPNLFCAIDDKAIAMDLTPVLSIDHDGNRAYCLDPYASSHCWYGEGPDRLAAAISAVLKYIDA